MNDNNTNVDGYSSTYYSTDNITTADKSSHNGLNAVNAFMLVLQFLSHVLQRKNTTDEEYRQIYDDFIR